MSVKKILLIDDDPAVRGLISSILRKKGMDVVLAKEGNEGLQLVQNENPDLVVCDFQMPGMNGLEVLDQIKKNNPQIPVIILTAYGDAALTIQSMQTGAFDFIEKPINPRELLEVTKNALKTIGPSKKDSNEEATLHTKKKDENLMAGKSPAMREIFKITGRISQSNVNVMITGETGTGKERLARLIHESGTTKNAPLIVFNCRSIQKDQLISACRIDDDQPAGSGSGLPASIILDDVGALSDELQVLLLDLLTREEKERPPNAKPRLISISNNDIISLVEENKFLKELYYRMKVFSLHIPPLRQRKEDIPDLVNNIVQELNPMLNKNIVRIEEGVIPILQSYDWPGNVQELKNILMQAMVLAHGDLLEKTSIFIKGMRKETEPGHSFEKPPRSLAEVEKEHIAHVLNYVKWSKQDAASILGITRPTLNAKIEKYQITKP